MNPSLQETPLSTLTTVTQRVVAITDRLVGDRGYAPIFVAKVLEHALKLEDISAAVIYGEAAWAEVVPDENGNPRVQWGGRWHQDPGSQDAGNFYFWVETRFGEWVDLTAASISRGSRPKALWAPPLLWSRSVPSFYKFKPHGMAEVEFTEPNQLKLFNLACEEIAALRQDSMAPKDPATESSDLLSGLLSGLLNEPLLISRLGEHGQRDLQVVDDSRQSFLNFDRALSVLGLPEGPPLGSTLN